MKLIIKPRQSGKTSELISMSEETNAYILTPNRMMAQHISKMAEEQGHNILFPVTLDEYLNSRFKGSHVRHILIDDADMILQQIFNEVTIDAITMSEQEPTVQAVPIEVLQEIRQEIESNMESITGKYDSNTPTRDLPSYKIERNEGRKECIKLIDSKIKELSE